jgi:hypothetical protein
VGRFAALPEPDACLVPGSTGPTGRSSFNNHVYERQYLSSF